MTKADLNKSPEQVSKMFDEVAHAYDKTNDLLSFGQARLWRRALTQKVDAKSGERILDIAAGTGTSSMALRSEGVEVVAADFSKGMLAEGKKPMLAASAITNSAVLVVPIALRGSSAFEAVSEVVTTGPQPPPPVESMKPPTKPSGASQRARARRFLPRIIGRVKR